MHLDPHSEPDPSSLPPESLDELLDFAFRDEPAARLPDPASGSEPLAVPAPDGAPYPDLGTARYRILGELGRGGMGRVLSARDRDLGREVAIKVLHLGTSLDQGLLRRFLEEAEITSQLQHPGIVPVYDLGIAPGGIPFLVMKRIRGRTLAAELRGLQDLGAARHQLLGIFAQVCQAVAYAHARGVLHRDLKPSNVMLGEFGEVQVMDWGLAKVLASRRADPVTIADPEPLRLRADSATRSTPGSALGTPAFMAPEQARGNTDMDARTDVFALGGILCELLTGKPPFVADSAVEQRQLAAAAQVAPAHELIRAATREDPELGELAIRCLAAQRAQRFAQAGEVHTALAAHLAAAAERAHTAELEVASARAQERSQRRAKRMAWALVGVVLAAGIMALWFERSRKARAIVTVRAVEQGLAAARDPGTGRTAAEELQQAQAALAAVERAAAAAEAGDADAAIRERVAREHAGVTERMSAANTRIRQEEEMRVLEERLDLLNSRSTEQEEEVATYRGLLMPLGIDPDGRRDPAEIAATLQQHPLRHAVVTACLGWSALRRTTDPGYDWLRAVAERLEPCPLNADIRRASQARDAQALLELRTRARTDMQAALLLASRLDDVKRKSEAEEFLRSLVVDHPDHWELSTILGVILLTGPEPAEAMEYLRAALALRPNSLKVHVAMIAALFRVRREAESLAMLADLATNAPRCEANLDALLGLCSEDWGPGRTRSFIISLHRFLPPTCRSLQRLGMTYGKEPDGHLRSVPLFRQALAAHQGAHRDLHLSELGHALLRMGHSQEAAERFAEAFKEAPEKLDHGYNRLVAMALSGDDHVESAVLDFVGRFPDHALGQVMLANQLVRRGRPSDAESTLRACIARNPACTAASLDLGHLLRRQGRLAEAYAIYRDSLHHGTPTRQALLGSAHCQLYRGCWLPGLGHLAMMPFVPTDPDWLVFASSEARYLNAQGHLRAAVSLLLPIAADNVAATIQLLNLIAGSDGPEGAADMVRRLLRRNPSKVSVLNVGLNFMAEHDRPDLVEELAAFGLQVNPREALLYRWARDFVRKGPDGHEQLYQILRAQLRVDPDNDILHPYLADAAFNAGDMELAIAMARRVLSRSPGDTHHTRTLFAALVARGEEGAAQAMVDQVLSLTADEADALLLTVQALTAIGQIEAASGLLHKTSAKDGKVQAVAAYLARWRATAPRLDAIVDGNEVCDPMADVPWLLLARSDRRRLIECFRRYGDRIPITGPVDALILCPAAIRMAGVEADGARVRRWAFDSMVMALAKDQSNLQRRVGARRLLGDLRLRPFRDSDVLDRLSPREREAWENLWRQAAALVPPS